MEALGPVLQHLIDSLGHHLSLGDQLTGIKHGLPRTRGRWGGQSEETLVYSNSQLTNQIASLELRM